MTAADLFSVQWKIYRNKYLRHDVWADVQPTLWGRFEGEQKTMTTPSCPLRKELATKLRLKMQLQRTTHKTIKYG